MSFEYFKPRHYADLGKTLGKFQVGDFGTPLLDRSDDGFYSQVEKEYQKIYTVNFRSGNKLIDEELENGKITVALTKAPYRDFYYYIQLQKRNESEFFVGEKRQLGGRDFNQARYIGISKDDFEILAQKKLTVFSGLFSEKLKDYIHEGELRQAAPISLQKISDDDAGIHSYVKKIVNRFYFEIIQRNNSSLFLTIIAPRWSLQQRLSLLDSIQYYLYPICGVITFKLDIVSSNFPVMLTILDEDPKEATKSSNLKRLDDLETPNSPDYYDFVSNLEPSLFFYIAPLIKDGFSLDIVLDIACIERLDSENSKESVNRICQHLKKPLPRNYLQKLIGKILEIQHIDLVSYYSYHLSAISGQVDRLEAIDDLRKFFFRIIKKSSENTLDEIPEELIGLIYKELFLTDILIRDTPLSFKEDVGYLEAIKKRPAQKYLLMMKELGEIKVKKSIIKKTLVNINGEVWVWDIRDIMELWGVIPEFHDKDFYVYFLKWILESLTEKFSTLEDQPHFFVRNFILIGRDIFESECLLKVLIGIKSKTIKEIVQKLRQLSIKLSASETETGLNYASWWLVSEQEISGINVLGIDLVQILNEVKLHKYENIASDSPTKYLLTGGKTASFSSLYKACEQITIQEGYLNVLPTFYLSSVQVWIECGYLINNADIEYITQQLPESLPILEGIIDGANDEQKSNIQAVSSLCAIHWIKNTRSRGYEYINNQDKLYNILLGIQNPSEEFLRYILFEYSWTFSKESGWHDYLVQLENEISDLCVKAKILKETDIYRYIELAKLVRDPMKRGAKYRKCLEIIACNPELAEDILNNDFITELLIIERVEEDERINQVVRNILDKVEFQKVEVRLKKDVRYYLSKYKEQQGRL